MSDDVFVWPERNPDLGAWFGSQALKDRTVARMIEHRAQDRLLQRHYQFHDGSGNLLPADTENYNGCLVGCTLPLRRRIDTDADWDPDFFLLPDGTRVEASGDWHDSVQDLYGIPWWVAEELDNVFEFLEFDDAAVFAVESLQAIPVGMKYPRESEPTLRNIESVNGPTVLEWLADPS